jgi:hypothetical protein
MKLLENVTTARMRTWIGCRRSPEVDVQSIASTLMRRVPEKSELEIESDILKTAIILEISMRMRWNDLHPEKAMSTTVLVQWGLLLLLLLVPDHASLQRPAHAPPLGLVVLLI